MAHQGPQQASYRKSIKNLDRSRAQYAKSVSRHGFDPDTGHVFHETEVVFRGRNGTNWLKEFKTPDIVLKAKPAGTGVRSLFDMAKSKCVTELRNFIPEHFEAVPWAIAKALWDEVVERHMESYYSWRLLASTYNEPDEFAMPGGRYHIALKQPPLPLKEYYNGLTSGQQQWHVAIRISPKQTSTASDLVALSGVTNLAALDLSDGQLLFDASPCIFDIRVMRTWAELASSRRAFQELRILMFGWQDNLSDWLFCYLDSFPLLQHVIVTDCKDLHQKNRLAWEQIASDAGWTALHAKKSAKTLRRFLEDGSFQLGSISNLYYHSQDVLESAELTSKVGGIVRPLVECWIGTPRSWTHIIDEFPGTRTIWFERTVHRLQPVVPEATKRVRDKASTPDATPSPPAKRAQRKTKPAHRYRATADAHKMLTGIKHSSTHK